MKYIIPTLAILLLAQLLQAQPEITLQPLDPTFTRPVFVTHAGDDRLFVLEQGGRIMIMDEERNKLAEPFLDIRAKVNSTGNERGLLGLAFHPSYKENGYFYVNYTFGSSGDTRVARYKVSDNDANLADEGSEEVVIEIDQPYSNHNGGGILFGPADGYLYIGLGDGGAANDPQNKSQDPESLLGKMLRIDVDNADEEKAYAVPADNPFIDDSETISEIWSIGLRNPWRFSFDAFSHDLWMGDVGQNDWEEIDFEPAMQGGLNYGWRCYEGDEDFNLEGCGDKGSYAFPAFVYPNTSEKGCSVTGGYVYRGAKNGNLYGKYIFTDYCSGLFWMTEPDGDGGWKTTELNKLTRFQYSSFGEGVDHELYVTGLTNGKVFELREDGCESSAGIRNKKEGSEEFFPLRPSPERVEGDLCAVGPEENEYTWFWAEDLNGEFKEVEDLADQACISSTYLDDELNPGYLYLQVKNGEGCESVSQTWRLGATYSSSEEIANSDFAQVWPNPAANELYIDLKESANQLKLQLFSISGRLLLDQQYTNQVSQLSLELDEVPNGIYMLRLSNGTQFYQKKLKVIK